jgi:hypothetical protein
LASFPIASESGRPAGLIFEVRGRRVFGILGLSCLSHSIAQTSHEKI